METRRKKRLRLLNSPDKSEPNTNHDDSDAKLTSKASRKRQHAADEASGSSGKRARTDATSKLADASGKPKTVKALRPDVLLPAETLVDLLRPLTRDDLEGSQLVNRKFSRASTAIFKSGDVPPRHIEHISVMNSEHECDAGRATFLCMNATRSSTDVGVSGVLHWCLGVEWLANVMRFSVVKKIDLIGRDKINVWGITREIWSGFLDTFRDAMVDSLRLYCINFCPLTAANIDRLATLNLRTELYFSASLMLSKHITDDFLRKLSRMNLSQVTLNGSVPADKATFDASDDGVLALCFPDDRPRTEGRLSLDNVGLTEAFFGKFLQKCQAAPEGRPFVKCHVHPVPAGTEREIMTLNPTRHVDENGDIFFFFEGTGCAFAMCRSKVPETVLCRCS
ncbi:hypothetical protein AAVH_24035 [Aphelenchoides avenae]|nr:hypothetical protein AAVH_24035 [Aphelenchus avenae]